MELPVSLLQAVSDGQEALIDVIYRIGLGLIKARLNDEVNNVVGPWYQPHRVSPWQRWTNQKGYVVWAGKKINLKHPRVRSKDGKQERPLESYQAFQREAGLDERLKDRIVLGLSSRDDKRAIDEFYEGYGLSKSRVSRRFIRVTSKKLEELMERPSGQLDLVVIGIDGIEVAGEVRVIAVGID